MNNMSSEVDYRLAKILFADMCEKKVIRTKKEKGIVQATLLERYDPPFCVFRDGYSLGSQCR